MQGILKVTPETLESTANEFSGKGQAVSQLTAQMTDMVCGLSSVWEGDAATAYTTKFRQLDDDIQKMIKMIQEHAQDLNEMARIYREAETANAEEASGLPGDVIV
ncbi:MAG: WXG100 family type VII secretion target [Lachnospiraceae bacterium]|nr:WXG100 family type VII secretion target [Lachnospiraceae bacterium]